MEENEQELNKQKCSCVFEWHARLNLDHFKSKTIEVIALEASYVTVAEKLSRLVQEFKIFNNTIKGCDFKNAQVVFLLRICVFILFYLVFFVSACWMTHANHDDLFQTNHMPVNKIRAIKLEIISF